MVASSALAGSQCAMASSGLGSYYVCIPNPNMPFEKVVQSGDISSQHKYIKDVWCNIGSSNCQHSTYSAVSKASGCDTSSYISNDGTSVVANTVFSGTYFNGTTSVHSWYDYDWEQQLSFPIGNCFAKTGHTNGWQKTEG